MAPIKLAPGLRLLLRILGLAILYFLSARLGLSMAFPVEQVSAVWPSSGLALSALLLFGPRVWPGVFLGALSANLLADETVLAATGIATGNTLEALVGSSLLRGAGFRPSLARLKDVTSLLLLAAVLSTLVSAVIGGLSLCSSGVQPWSSFLSLVSVWWLGDAMGELVVAPLLLAWAAPLPRAWTSLRSVEAAALFLSLVLVASTVFLGGLLPRTGHFLAYVVFPFIVWAALRFGQRGTTLATVIASGIAILGTVKGLGPYSAGTVGQSLVLLQTFQGVLATTGLLLAAAMTERKNAEAERNRLLVKEREARLGAEQANRLKDEFLATLSHELRTPLTSILGWANLLRGGKLPPEETGHAIEVIERNARHQTQLIEDLLDVSRIMSGKFSLEVQRTELIPVIASALEAIRPAAEAKEIEIHRRFDPEIQPLACDPTRLQQVVWNLVANAVKFTGQGGRIEVSLENRGAHVEIAVKDTGQGIQSDFLPHVFERFRQADSSTTRRHSGLGLGLAIVRHLVEAHGGTVQARSPGEGQGATFVVQLPVAMATEPSGIPTPALPRQPAPSPPRMLRGVCVLVVDDEADALQLVKTVLENSEAEVITASSAAEAMEILNRVRPHVLISDIAMPAEDGYSLLRRVRASLPEVPAIALTAYVRREEQSRISAAGFHAHLAKPIEGPELLALIAGLARSARKRPGSVRGADPPAGARPSPPE